jgi:hypothetical protein
MYRAIGVTPDPDCICEVKEAEEEDSMSEDREHYRRTVWCNPKVEYVPPIEPAPVDETVGPLDEYRGQ